jgi:DNA primase
MSIDFDKFLNWVESRFDDFVVSGNEVKLNSIFCDDHKRHLWCNPYGGKTGNPHGVFHCWKTDQKGNLITLVMQVDKCSYEEALETLDTVSEGSLADLEIKVQEMFDKNTNEKYEFKEKDKLTMPSGCYSFNDLSSSNYLKKTAQEYIESRKLNTENLYVCTSGRYRNRILIPYYDIAGNLIYYNGRYIGDPGANLRYLGPPKELGIGKGDVLYCPRWPKKGEKIYITEGEFDAMSLFTCGFNSVALGGKSMTENQIEMIKEYIPVLCLDADGAGTLALPKIANFLFQKGFKTVFYVRPCLEFKDWNGLLVEKGEKILKYYIKTQEKPYNSSISGGDWESTRLSIKNLIN